MKPSLFLLLRFSAWLHRSLWSVAGAGLAVGLITTIASFAAIFFYVASSLTTFTGTWQQACRRYFAPLTSFRLGILSFCTLLLFFGHLDPARAQAGTWKITITDTGTAGGGSSPWPDGTSTASSTFNGQSVPVDLSQSAMDGIGGGEVYSTVGDDGDTPGTASASGSGSDHITITLTWQPKNGDSTLDPPPHFAMLAYKCSVYSEAIAEAQLETPYTGLFSSQVDASMTLGDMHVNSMASASVSSDLPPSYMGPNPDDSQSDPKQDADAKYITELLPVQGGVATKTLTATWTANSKSKFDDQGGSGGDGSALGDASFGYSLVAKVGGLDVGRSNGRFGTWLDGIEKFFTHDPSFTRWLPLEFSANIDSQPLYVSDPHAPIRTEKLPPFWGNLNCAFSIALHPDGNPDNNGTGNYYIPPDDPGDGGNIFQDTQGHPSGYVITDANGDRLTFDSNFSPSSDILSTFTVGSTGGGGGYTLSNAGPPGHIRERGHYTYTFDNYNSGNLEARLLGIADDLGNQQTLSYSSGLPNSPFLTVTDQTSSRQLLFYGAGDGFVGTVVAPVLFGTTALTTTVLSHDSAGHYTGVAVYNGDGTGSNSTALAYTAYQYTGDSPTRIADGLSTEQMTYTNSPGNPTSPDNDAFGKPITRVSSEVIGLQNDPTGAYQSITQYQYGTITQGYGFFGIDSRTNYVTDPNGNQTQLIYSYPNPYSSGGSSSSDDGAIAGLQTTGPAFTGATGSTPNVWLQGWLPDISHPAGYQMVDPLGGDWQTSFDASSQPLTIADPMSHQTTLTWNGTDLTSVQDPTGLLWQFGYASGGGGNVNKITDPANRILTNVLYNSFGQAQSVTIPAAVSATGLDQTETVTYDTTTGDLTSAAGAMGDQWLAGILNPSTHALVPGSDYDALGDLLGSSLFPDTGNPQTSLAPLSSTIAYSATQMPVRITGPTGSSIAYDYTNGVLTDFRLLNPQNAQISQVQYQHDSHGRVYRAQDSVGALFGLVYDANSNVTQFRDGNGHATGFGYGGNDEPTGLSWPDGHSTSVLYNNLGLVRQATDERGIVANYAYDPAWRLQSVAIPSDPNRNTAFTYDAAGRLLSATDAAGNAVTYQYNPADKRLASVTTTQDGFAYTVYYSYYGDGTLQSMTSPAGATGYIYNVDGTLHSLTNPLGETTSWAADHAGRATAQTTSAPGGLTVGTTYGYGTSGQASDSSTAPAYQSSITNTVNGTVVASYQVTHSYLGQVLSQHESLSGETLSFAYDARGRLQSYNNQLIAAGFSGGGSASPVYEAGTFGYDLANNLIPLSGDGSVWQYNTSNQVTSAPPVQHAVSAGDPPCDTNLTGDGGSGGAMVGCAAAAALSSTNGPPGSGGGGFGGLSYDAAGNLNALQGDAFTWDTLGNLSSVAWSSPSLGFGGPPVSHTAVYTYDLLGRRATKSIDGTLATRYLYDGALLIAETNAGGQITRTYTWGALGLISDNRGGGGGGSAQSEFYLYDASASTRTLIASDGHVLWQCGYSAWGTPVNTTAPSSGGLNAFPNPSGPPPVYSGPTPFAWNGRVGNYTDAETGLTLIGARYYAPGIGRFLSRDPSGYSGGTNVYAYCAGDPIDFCDPDGQCPLIIGATIGGALLGAGLDGWLAYEGGARGAALLGAAGRGALVGAAAGAASCLLGPEAGLGVWGSAIGGGALGGAAGNLAGQAVDNATGRQHGLNLKSVAKDAIIGGALGAALHAAGPFLQKVFCFDGDTPVQVAPQAAQVAQVATISTSSSSGKNTHGKTASLGLPAPSTSTKKIKDMKPGDLVASRNARTGQVEYKKVLGVSRSISPRLLAVSIADKKTGKLVEVIKATPEHPFFTSHGLVSAEKLGIGTELVTRAGPQSGGNAQVLVVKAVTPVPAVVGKDGKRAGFVVYNLEVEDDHTYFVGNADGGAWVHNACALSVSRFIHILDRHKPGGVGSAGKSLFNAGESVTDLIRAANSTQPVPAGGSNFARVVNAGRMIGFDRSTGFGATPIYTVITDGADNVITAHPGLPTGMPPWGASSPIN